MPAAAVIVGCLLVCPPTIGSDPGSDTGADSGGDSGPDSGSDSGSDAGSDTGSDSGTDSGSIRAASCEVGDVVAVVGDTGAGES